MQNLGVCSFWPKPILHPSVFGTLRTYILMKFCGFCVQVVHCPNVVLTSCKHTFHPFSLIEVLWDNNKCTCGQVMHLDWWQSFGYGAEDGELRNWELIWGLKVNYKQ
jgi:hypothetical protein